MTIVKSTNHTFTGITDEVAEWLRRWTANPLGSARVGSNPILVVDFVYIRVDLHSKFKNRSSFRFSMYVNPNVY